MMRTMSPGWRRWQPWTVVLLGVTVFGLTALDLAVSPGSPASLLFEASVPAIMSTGVVGFGLWLHTTDFDDDELTRIVAWYVGSTVGIGLLGGWAFLVMRDAGVPTADASFVVLAAVAFGGAVGVVVSLYDARQRRLRARTQRFRDALDASVDGIATVGPDGRIDALNRSMAEIMGYDDPDDLVGESWRRLHPDDTAAEFAETVMPTLRDAGSWRGEVAAVRADGGTFPAEMSLSLLDDGGSVAVLRDVTERNEREEELLYQSSLLSAQFEASRDGILIVDGDWEVLAFNERFAEQWDVPPEIGESEEFDVLGVMAERLASSTSMRKRVEHLQEHPFEPESATIQAKDGRIFDRYSAPIMDGETHFGRVFTFRDVTEDHRRDRTVEALHQASHQLAYADDHEAVAKIAVDVARQVFTKPVSGVWLMDESEGALRPTAASPIAEERLRAAGHDEPPLLGPDSPEMDLLGEDEVVVIGRDDEDAAACFAGLDLGTLVLLPLGDHGVMALGDPEPASLSGAEHQLVGMLRQHVIAALDRVERAPRLAEREQRLRTIVENVPIVLFAFDRDGVFTLSEGFGLEGIGLEPGEVVGDTVEEVFAQAPELIETCRRALDGEAFAETTEFGGRTFDGWFDPVVEDGEVRQVIGTAVDVSARARYERSIEALHSATREMMVADDVETIGQVVTDTARDVLSLPMSGVWLVSGGGDCLEPLSLTPEGRELVGDAPAFDAGRGLAWRAFETGETLQFDDVDEERSVYDPETPIRSELVVPIDRYGVLVSGSAVRADFDENDVALAELLAANATVAIDRMKRAAALRRQTEQFEFFNSILRHDVLNGMTVIRSRGEFLAERLDGEERRFAETIVEWSEDIVDVVGRVRRVLETLTSERDASLEPVDVAAIIDDRVGRVTDTYPSVEFSVAVPEGLYVTADELLSDVVGNVITNAIEHNQEAGLQVHVSATADGNEATIRIADNGTGIEEDHRETVFRRGETGHAKATGSGFGLFFVDAMVERYGGDVWVEDNDAGGATFAIKLPLAGGPGE